MPTIPNHLNPIDILAEFKEKGESRSNISSHQRDSKFRAISDVLTEELLNLKEEQIALERTRQLSSATGKALADIGQRLGEPPIRPLHARVDVTERNIAFYVESGTFGTINGASNIVLPANTRIFTEPNSNELNTSIEYTLIQSYTLLASESLQYVSARAVNIGTPSNVGELVLRQHNVTNYSDSANNSLKVINFYPILNGVDEEKDDLYRFRLANKYNSIITNNETKLRLGALTIPGIVNTRVEPAYYGIGTAAVFALGPENQANESLIRGLQSRLDSWKVPSGDYIATPGTQVHFDFELEVRPTKTLTNSQIARLKSEINRSFLTYFRSLGIGSVVDLSLLASQVQQRVVTVASLNQKNLSKTFKKVYIRKSFSGGALDEKSKLLANSYILERDEFASLGSLSIEIV